MQKRRPWIAALSSAPFYFHMPLAGVLNHSLEKCDMLLHLHEITIINSTVFAKYEFRAESGQSLPWYRSYWGNSITSPVLQKANPLLRLNHALQMHTRRHPYLVSHLNRSFVVGYHEAMSIILQTTSCQHGQPASTIASNSLLRRSTYTTCSYLTLKWSDACHGAKRVHLISSPWFLLTTLL